MTSYDAVLLAGGQARRLGGANKPSLAIAGVTLLDRVLAAVGGAGRRIVVGPPTAGSLPYILTRELPPGGGPVAAIAAGLAHVQAPIVVVLAADLPFVTPATVEALVAATGAGAVAAVLVDDTGRDQLLVAAWRTDALRTKLALLGHLEGQAARRLYDTVAVARVAGPQDTGQPPPWLDCDTEDDLRRAREWT
ncbi:MAG: molybdenum cofactor guanylyltransferase [Pseudonocardiales bacterium]